MKCSVCTHDDAQEFHDLNDLEAHIAAEHFDCLPFECEKCRYSKFPTEFAIRRHFEEDHRMSEYFIRYKQSNDLTEKLCAVRECLQQSCETASIDFPYTSYPAINNINDAMSAYYTRRASYRPSRRPPRSNASSADGVGEPNCENYDAYSPSNSTEADVPLAGGVAVANGDGPSAALTAFLQNATQVMSGANNAEGDSNNNDEKPSPNSDEIGAFCSQILQRQHRRGSSVNHHGNETLANGPDDTDDGGALGSDFGENADENRGISNQLLQHLSQLQAPKTANMQMRRPNKRLMGKGLNAGTMRHPKRRFGHDSHNVSCSHNFPMQHRHGGQSGVFGPSRNMHHNNGGGMNSGFSNFFGSMGAPNFGMANVPPAAIISRTAQSRMPSKVNEVQCQECKEMVTNRATSLNYHVNMKHLKFALFICKGCQRNFLWQRTTIVTHVQRYHNGDESLIQDNSSQYMSLINLRRKVYFPTKGPAGATATITNATPITDTSIADTSSVADTSPAMINNGDGGGGEYDDSHANTPINQTPSTSLSANCGEVGNNGGGQMDINDQGEDIGSGDGDSADDDEEGEASNGGDMDDDQASEMSHHNNNMHHQNGFGQFGQFHHNNQHHRHNHHSSSPVSPSAGDGQQPHNGRHFSHNDMNFGFYSGYGMYGNNMPPDVAEGDEMNGKKGRQLQCQECNEMVVATKPWILLNHANSQHLHFPLFECGACQQVFTKYLRSYTVTHMKRYHEGREDLIIDNRSIYHGQLQAKCQELFGVSV